MSIPNFISILGQSCFLDATGAPLAKGTLVVAAVDGTGRPIPFHVGGGGIALVHNVTRTITDGSLDATLQLANPAAADISIGYTFTVTDSASYETTTFDRVAITADGSGNFDLSALSAGSYANAEPVAYVSGKSAYDVAVDNGFEGSEEEWLASLVGPAGNGEGGSSSPATDAAFGTVKLATGQTATTLAKVATTGTYADLTGKPTLATVASSGAYADLTGTPTLATVATSGSYADLTGKPALAQSATTDTTNATNISAGTLPAARLPDATAAAHGAVKLATGQTSAVLAVVATSGAYSDLAGTPALATVATSGTYADLTGKPTLATVASSGSYADLTGKPTFAASATTDTTNATNITSGTLGAARLPDATAAAHGAVKLATGQTSAVLSAVATSGAYSDVSGTPVLATVATSGTYTDLTGKPTFAAVATSGSYADLTGKPTLATVATSGSYADLTGKPSLAASATTDTTNASSISSGTLAAARLPAAAVQTGSAATGQFSSTPFALTDAGTIAVNWANGLTQKVTLGGTRTITFTGAQTGARYLLELTQDVTGSRAVSWPTIRWQGGAAPTLTTTPGKTDLVALVYDGTDYFGQAALGF